MHLQAGRAYESERKVLDSQLAVRARSFDPRFLEQYGPVLQAVSVGVADERLESPWLVDQDVSQVYTALLATMKTLASGIYYETVPDGPARIGLFRRLKSILDSFITPPDPQFRALRVSEILSILEFLLLSVAMNTSGRPRSRQYLDWVSAIAGRSAPSPESSRLIIP